LRGIPGERYVIIEDTKELHCNAKNVVHIHAYTRDMLSRFTQAAMRLRPDRVILGEVRGYVEEGVTLATFGFGMDNYNDTLMEQLADNGDGMYAYIDDMNEARHQFIDNLTSNLQTIAMDAKVQVDFNPEVVMRYRLVGFENRAIADEDFRDNKVDAGEIGAGHSVTALYEVKLYSEAYGRIGDWDRVKAGRFTADYARLCDPEKPVVWAEMGYDVWDRTPMAPSPGKLAFAARYFDAAVPKRAQMTDADRQQEALMAALPDSVQISLLESEESLGLKLSGEQVRRLEALRAGGEAYTSRHPVD
jgi:hypothetical protein